VAPEILEGEKYGKAVDMWSIGVITYIILGGYPPFHDDNQKALFRKIRKAEFEFHPNYWEHVSQEAKDLIKGMLTKVSKEGRERGRKEGKKDAVELYIYGWFCMEMYFVTHML
jgi:serine/threonine protein kinase